MVPSDCLPVSSVMKRNDDFCSADAAVKLGVPLGAIRAAPNGWMVLASTTVHSMVPLSGVRVLADDLEELIRDSERSSLTVWDLGMGQGDEVADLDQHRAPQRFESEQRILPGIAIEDRLRDHCRQCVALEAGLYTLRLDGKLSLLSEAFNRGERDLIGLGAHAAAAARVGVKLVLHRVVEICLGPDGNGRQVGLGEGES